MWHLITFVCLVIQSVYFFRVYDMLTTRNRQLVGELQRYKDKVGKLRSANPTEYSNYEINLVVSRFINLYEHYRQSRRIDFEVHNDYRRRVLIAAVSHCNARLFDSDESVSQYSVPQPGIPTYGNQHGQSCCDEYSDIPF